MIWALACSAAPPDSTCTVASPLVSGSASENYLGQDDLHRSIGILSASTDSTLTCTGSWIASEWVLAAKHCMALHDADLGPALFAIDGLRALEVTAAASHPFLDVALFRVEHPSCHAPRPLPIAQLDTSLLIDDTPRLSRGVLAGAGIDEHGEQGSLEFLVEPVVGLTDERIVVDGGGQTGACAGDSGGPLLVRDDTGAVAVFGVLSEGDADCRGRDHYIRVDRLREWIETQVELPNLEPSCGSLDASGRCFDGRALFCDDGRVRVERCAQASCGWSPADGGYRCGGSLECTGDAWGSCEEGAAVFCGPDGSSRTECGEGSCGIDSVSGQAACG